MKNTLNERGRRQAQTRAAAAALVDAPRVSRRYTGKPTRTSNRRRSTSGTAQPVSDWRLGRKRLALVLVMVQATALAVLFTLPIFKVEEVKISGLNVISREAVLSTAKLSSPSSIFLINGQQIQDDLQKIPWIKNVSVKTLLPNRVSISLTERDPILRIHTAKQDVVIANSAATLDTKLAQYDVVTKLPVVTDERANSPATNGVFDDDLMRLLSTTSAQFPKIFGCQVAEFKWDTNGIFSIGTTCNWQAILGHLDTKTAISQIPGQLAALASLKGQLNFAQPNFGYVQLENPAEPAVGGQPVPITVPPLPKSATPTPDKSTPTSSKSVNSTSTASAKPASPTPIVFGRPLPGR